MRRKANKNPPLIISGRLYTDDAFTGTLVDSPTWFVWLTTGSTFFYQTPHVSFTARREKRRQGYFWYAFRKLNGTLRKRYLGPDAALTAEHLSRVAQTFEPDPTIDS